MNILEQFERIPKEHQPLAALAMVKDHYLTNFFSFAKDILGYKDLEKEVHGQFIKVFESNAPRKIVVMPRGSFKSSLGSVAYPIWCLLRDPNDTILLDSELYSNSKNFLREIKAHFESDRFTRYFGDHVGPKWDEGEIIVKTRTANIKEASLTVGGLGTTKIGQHYKRIIGDDYNSPQNSETPEKCQKVIDHVRYNLNLLNPGGEYLIIGTRYAERDVIGFFLGDVLGETNLAEGKLMRTLSAKTESNELLIQG